MDFITILQTAKDTIVDILSPGPATPKGLQDRGTQVLVRSHTISSSGDGTSLLPNLTPDVSRALHIIVGGALILFGAKKVFDAVETQRHHKSRA